MCPLLGKWLIAAFQTVQRGVINIFSTPEEAPTTQSVKKEAGMPSSSFTSTTVSVPSSALIVANSEGELPYRIERDETLQNRKIMTQTDFKCPLSDYDIHRMTTFETRDRDDDTLTKIKQQMEEIGNGLNTKTGKSSLSILIHSSSSIAYLSISALICIEFPPPSSSFHCGSPHTPHHTTSHHTTQHHTPPHNTTPHNTTQHNTTPHNTTQHHTTQHNSAESVEETASHGPFFVV